MTDDNLVISIAWSILGTVAVVLNAISLVSVYLTKELTHSQRLFLWAFAVSDFMGGVIMQAEGFVFFVADHTDCACSVWRWGLMSSHLFDIYLLLGFSSHRAAILQWPFSAYKLEKRLVIRSIILAAAAMAALAVSILMMECYTSLSSSQALTIDFTLMVIPFLIMAITDSFLLTMVCRKSMKMVERRQEIQGLCHTSAVREVTLVRHIMQVKRFRRHVNVALATLLVFLSFLVLTFPLLVTDIVLFLHVEQDREKMQFTEDVTLLVASVNSIINPILLCLRLRVVRCALYRHLGCKASKKSAPPDVALAVLRNKVSSSRRRRQTRGGEVGGESPKPLSAVTATEATRRRSKLRSSSTLSKLKEAIVVMREDPLPEMKTASISTKSSDLTSKGSAAAVNVQDDVSPRRVWLKQGGEATQSLSLDISGLIWATLSAGCPEPQPSSPARSGGHPEPQPSSPARSGVCPGSSQVQQSAPLEDKGEGWRVSSSTPPSELLPVKTIPEESSADSV